MTVEVSVPFLVQVPHMTTKLPPEMVPVIVSKVVEEVAVSLSKTNDKSDTVRRMHNFKSKPSLNLILDFSFSTFHFASALTT